MAERVRDRDRLALGSWSPKVAADMVRGMVGDAGAGRGPAAATPTAGSAPTSPRSGAAINHVYAPAGVAMLVDLGGALTNSEMAIELLPLEQQGEGGDLQCADRRGCRDGRRRGVGRRRSPQVRAVAEELSP